MPDSTRLIPLSQGKFAIVDADLFDWLNQWKWSFMPNNRTGYAIRMEGGKAVLMHRRIMNALPCIQVDHLDHDGLNNTRANLRLCTNTENQRNRPKSRGNFTSRFKGVMWCKRSNRWRAKIKLHYKIKYLGTYRNEVEAAHAYDAAARLYFGEYAVTNF